MLDSDSDSETETTQSKDMAAINRRMAAQKLEADRTGELAQLQARQKKESERQQQRRAQNSRGVYGDIQDLDFGSISSKPDTNRLPAPIRPDSADTESNGG